MRWKDYLYCAGKDENSPLPKHEKLRNDFYKSFVILLKIAVVILEKHLFISVVSGKLM
jgi:hypothetical protein